MQVREAIASVEVNMELVSSQVKSKRTDISKVAYFGQMTLGYYEAVGRSLR